MSLSGKTQCHITENYPEQYETAKAREELVKEFRIDLNKFEEEEFFDGEGEEKSEWNIDTYTDMYVGCNELLGNEKFMDAYVRLDGTFPTTGDLRTLLRNNRINTFSSEGIVLYIDNQYYETIGYEATCKGKVKGEKCGHKIQLVYKNPPKECPNCGEEWRKKNTNYYLEEFITVNVTFIQLGYYKKDNTLATVNAFIYGLNTDDITTGQKLKFNCFKNLQKFGKEGNKYEARLMIVGWESVDTTWEDIIIPVEYEQKFLEIKDNYHHFQRVIDSIAPNVIGYEDVKESMLLQAVMGGFEELVGGATARLWMCILLAGDPGVAKSQLLDWFARLHPKVAWGGGARATRAGVTVASIPDPRNKDRRIPKAGTLVMANKGLAIIDEFDKMSTEDKKSIQSAMEQGKIDVAMAEIQATFETMTSILAACNPKKAFFERNVNYEKEALDQLDISPEILSRFDYIWVIIDMEHAEKDNIISQSMRGSNKVGEPEFTMDYIKYYIAWIMSRRPYINEDVGQQIDEWYVEERKKIKDETKINPRLVQTLIRTCKALAKFRGYMDPLTGEYLVTMADFEEAKRLVHNMLATHGPTTGFGDVTRMWRGHSLKKENLYSRILNIISTQEPTDEELKDYLQDVDDLTLEKELMKLQDQRNGGIFKDRDGKWRCV